MKKVFVIIVLMIFSSQLFAQAETQRYKDLPKEMKSISKGDNGNPANMTSCPSGLYPNGSNCYPCLGCHPCGNTYCDNDNNKVVISISDLVPVNLIQEYEEGGAITNKISKKDLKRLIIENSTPNKYAKVKCNCGSEVYGKDADACKRICDFLGSQATVKH